jgi:hypothetical protein
VRHGGRIPGRYFVLDFVWPFLTDLFRGYAKVVSRSDLKAAGR